MIYQVVTSPKVLHGILGVGLNTACAGCYSVILFSIAWLTLHLSLALAHKFIPLLHCLCMIAFIIVGKVLHSSDICRSNLHIRVN